MIRWRVLSIFPTVCRHTVIIVSLSFTFMTLSTYLTSVCFIFQLIAAYSAPPAPPEAADFACESTSTRLDFKDSDMKRLSMEIERERWAAG